MPGSSPPAVASKLILAAVPEEGLEPCSVRWIIIPGLVGDLEATHGVDVTGEPPQRGIASLEAHAAYLAAIQGHPAPADFIPTLAAINGRAMGVEHAVLFRARDLQALPAFLTAADRSDSTASPESNRR